MASEEYLVDCIVQGKPYECANDTDHLNKLYRKFSHNAENGDPQKLNIFGKSEFQRVENVKEFFEWIPVPQSYFQRFQKSSKISALLRDRGNKAYLTDDYATALRAYNLAVVFAQQGDQELAFAYEKRADLFLTLNEPELAQRDINLAVTNAYPKKAAQKLIDLQNRCAVITNRKNATAQNNTTTIKEGRRFCHEKFFKLRTPHPHIQNMEEFVEIDYRSECGRRVVVSRDVPAGTVMLMDSPYAFMLVNLLKWDTEHCHFCTKPILGGIPCNSCTFAWFCSDVCLAKASTGMHKYEHKYLPYFQCHPMACRIVTACRIVFTAGPDKIFKIFKSQDPLFFSPKSGGAKGFNADGVYEVDSYLPIFHLISHPPSKFLKDISDVFKAFIMTNLIEQTTDFFRKPKYTDECSLEAFKDFVTSLILRHMRSFEFNAITMSKLERPIGRDPNNNSQQQSLANMKTVRYGAAVYPVLCLLNHSCDPNAVPVRSLKYCKTSVVALKNLKQGDEICISYTPIFTLQDTSERIKYLLDRYNFFCTCDACNHAWSNANRTTSFGESFCDKCHRYLLLGQCPACTQRDKDMPKMIEHLQLQAEVAEKLLESQKYKEAEELIVSCLQTCEGFSSCFGLFIDLQFLYKRALVGLFNQ